MKAWKLEEEERGKPGVDKISLGLEVSKISVKFGEIFT